MKSLALNPGTMHWGCEERSYAVDYFLACPNPQAVDGLIYALKLQDRLNVTGSARSFLKTEQLSDPERLRLEDALKQYGKEESKIYP